ncbi:MAG: type IV pilus biogenesis protein PilM [Dehalococcoidia bacterium]
MNLRSILRQPLLTIAIHEREARWTLGHAGVIATCGRVRLAPGLVSDGVILEPATAGAVLRAAPDFPGRGRMQVVIALPAQRSVFRTIEVPAVRGRAFDELAEREVRREMPMLAENAYVSWKRTGEGDGKVQLFVVGVARDVLDSHVAATHEAGLHPFSADLRVIAAARAAGAPDCIIANIEDEESEIAIVRGGVPAIVRVVAMSAPRGSSSWLEQVAEELARTVKFYRDAHRDDQVFDALPISMVGGAAQQAALGGDVATATGHSVEVAELLLAVAAEADAASFAVNVGLALKERAA